jgi:adenosylhomocysteine nucleosidase
MIGVDAVVVAAMADEAEAVLTRAQVVGQAVEVGGSVQRLLVIGDCTVLLVRSGIGLVNAAAAAAAALAHARPRALISAGSAGGVGLQVHVGDVVVAEETLFAGADATTFGYALGQVPGMPERFASHAALVQAALAAPAGLPVHSGLVLSADSFIDARTLATVRQTFPTALSTDMESAALSQVAHLFSVPFVSVRGVSDLCGPTAGQDHTVRVEDAADRSAAVIVAMLEQLDRAVLPAS